MTHEDQLVPRGTSSEVPDSEPRVPIRQPVPTLFTEVLAERISDLLVEGNTLAAISRMPEMPAYNTIFRWMKNQPTFRQQIKAARELRALHFEDQAIEVGTSQPEKDDVPGARLAAETFWKAAEVNDPTVYGKRTTVQGDASKPITFLIQTGFSEPPTGYQKPPELGPDGLIKPLVPELAEKIVDISDLETHDGPEDYELTPTQGGEP